MHVVRFVVVALAVVLVAGCQMGLSRPGFEFRVFRAPVALEPHLLEQRSGTLSALPLEPVGRRSFEPRIPPSTFTMPTPAMEEFAAPPLPSLRMGWRPVPQAVPMDPCLPGRMIELLERVERRLGPEQLAAPKKRGCSEE